MNSASHILKNQKRICKKYNISYVGIDLEKIIGVSKDFFENTKPPTHGLRHYETDTTSGWFMWKGEYSDADDFFEPYHVKDIIERLDEAVFYLALPPGWRFLIDPQKHYEDVWFDDSLLFVD